MFRVSFWANPNLDTVLKQDLRVLTNFFFPSPSFFLALPFFVFSPILFLPSSTIVLHYWFRLHLTLVAGGEYCYNHDSWDLSPLSLQEWLFSLMVVLDSRSTSGCCVSGFTGSTKLIWGYWLLCVVVSHVCRGG